jgi:putative ABC transport system permease protein
MFRNNIKLAWRYLLKDRSFTLLNLLGLATGLACAIMIYLWVNDEAHIDTFNQNNDRLVQILKNSPSPTGITTDDRTPGLLSATLASDMPDVAYATAVIPVSWFDKQGLLIHDGHRVTAKAAFAGPDYFHIFSYRLISGHADDVLQDKQSIVISSEIALNLFHTTEDLLGKNVEWNQKDYGGIYRISGVFEKPPANATAQSDIVFNYALFLDKNPKLTNCDQLKTLYQEYNLEGDFEYRFLDEDYQALYSAETRVSALSKYFAGMAIIISCLGLFGLAAFTAQKRQREIGIRKVLGATVNGIVLLLSKDFLILISLSLFIAFPLCWWGTNRWLHGFAYRADPGIGIYFLTGFTIIGMALLSIGFQSLKAACSNPVSSLRS